MKNCKSCGNSNPDNALFCSGCGGNDFAVNSAEENIQDGQFNFTPTEIKGKIKAWQIIVIALGCIALIAAGILAVKNILSVKSYSSGEMAEGVYTNDWAELKYVVPDGHTDITAEESQYYNDGYSDLGFCVVHETRGASVTIEYQDLGNTRRYSEREGMDDYLDGYAESFKEQFGVEPTISQYFDYTVAGKSYVTAKIDFGEYGIEYDCIRFEGNYAIVITVCAESEDEVKALLSGFEYYEAEK